MYLKFSERIVRNKACLRKALFATLIIVVTGSSIRFFPAASDAEEPQSLTIDQAVDTALRENRDLKAARIQTEEAKGRLVQAGLFPNPSLETDFSSDFVFANEGERDFSAGLFQPLSLSGRIGAQKKVARVGIKRTLADIADLERILVRDVRRAFIELLGIDEQIKLQDALANLNRELIKGIESGIREGLASVRDLNAVTIALQQARQEKEVLIAQRKSKILELNRLLGKSSTFPFLPQGKIEYEAAKDLTKYSVEKAYEQRPDLRLAELSAELASADLDLAKASRFEDVRAGISYEHKRDVLDIPEGSIPNTDNLIGIKLTIPLPFFDRKQGLIAETRARERRAEESVEALKLQISQEVSDALNRVNTLSALLDTYQSGILKTAEDNVKLVEGGYKEGLAGIADVIQSRLQFANLKSSYINTVRDYQIALNDLQISTGIYPGTITFNEIEKEDENK
ncbi:MAG: TolC family protein [Thermodesulfobacteriota bacterium]